MKLNTKRTCLVGLAFLSISAFWGLYDFVIPLVLKNTYGLGDTWAGVVMAMDNVLALFLLPFFGALSDKVRSPLGRRMPFIMGGTMAAVTLMLALALVIRVGTLGVFLACLALLLLAMGTYRSPAVALMPDVTPKPLRSKGNAVINLMGAVGGMAALLLVNVAVVRVAQPDGSVVPIIPGCSWAWGADAGMRAGAVAHREGKRCVAERRPWAMARTRRGNGSVHRRPGKASSIPPCCVR